MTDHGGRLIEKVQRELGLPGDAIIWEAEELPLRGPGFSSQPHSDSQPSITKLQVSNLFLLLWAPDTLMMHTYTQETQSQK